MLETHDLTRRLLDEVSALLAEKKLLLREGTLMDATIIAAPPSTKNRQGACDPEMHQTRRGQQWYFGMKAHLGAGDGHGLAHTVEGTAANVSDISQAHALLHGDEERAGVDAGYSGVETRPGIIAPGRAIDWRIAGQRSTPAKAPEGWAKETGSAWETLKARRRALVEHPCHIIKNLFHYRKVRCRGLAKNTSQLRALFALANLYRMRRHLMSAAACAPPRRGWPKKGHPPSQSGWRSLRRVKPSRRGECSGGAASKNARTV